MTKRNKLYTALLVKEWRSRPAFPLYAGGGRLDYLQFIRSQSRKNNPYAMALRQIEV